MWSHCPAQCRRLSRNESPADGPLTLHPPAVAAPSSSQPRPWLQQKGKDLAALPTGHLSQTTAFRWDDFFFPHFFFNFNFNKAKLIVCEMKEWILQQSYPSDNSWQFATEFPLASAMEQGLHFFFWVYFFLLPFPPPHTTRETDYMKKSTVK